MNFIHPKTTFSGIALITDCPKEGTSQAVAESYATTLKRLLSMSDINPDSVFIASLYEDYPSKIPTANPTGKGKERTFFDWTSFRRTPHVVELEKQLDSLKPSVIIPLGGFSLKYFKHLPSSLDEERGAPFKDKKDRLCVATYHPRDTFTRYELGVLMMKDFSKALRLTSQEWVYQDLTITSLPSFHQIIRTLKDYLERKPLLVCDIETYYGTKIKPLDGQMTCIGFSENETSAFVIPFVSTKKDRSPYWQVSEEVEIWKLLSKVLEECPLIGHNACHFDHYMLAENYGIDANFIHDTMFMSWSLHTEFPKSLAFCSSICTDNPFWKSDLSLARRGIIPRWKEFEYNGRDCAINMQVFNKLSSELDKESNSLVKEHYNFNIKTSKAYQYMSFMGARVDKDKLNDRIQSMELALDESQELINDSLGFSLNVKSPTQVAKYLYETLGLPKKFNTVKQADGSTRRSLSTDYLTILQLSKKHPELEILKSIGSLRKSNTRLSHLKSLGYDEEGVCRWTFNTVGTSTGRSSGYKPYNNQGVQPQNVDRRDRDLFLPRQDDHWWMKADLEGADSVTVAAILEYLGDSRLHDDLKDGLKPAQVLALSLLKKDDSVMDLSRSKIKSLLHLLKTAEGKHFYKVGKMVNHGSAYMLTPGGMSTQMFQQSDGDIYMEAKDCKKLQDLLFKRYDYRLYHEFMEGVMKKKPVLETSHGQRRRFYGRRDHSTLRDMLSFLPQAHTCYVTNKVINSLYYNPLNRNTSGNLVIKPCNQVHDETDSNLPRGQEARASKIFYSLCKVPLSIYGVDFEIKFEAEYGENWGEQPFTL